MFGKKVTEYRAKDHGRNRSRRVDPQQAAYRVARRDVAHVVVLGHQLDAARQKAGAVLGQAQVSGGAMEQRDPEFVLQLTDSLGYDRRRNRERTRRRGKTAEACGGQKGADVE